METKQCNQCHQNLPTTEYHKGSGKCKVCQAMCAKKLKKAKVKQCPKYGERGRFEP